MLTDNHPAVWRDIWKFIEIMWLFFLDGFYI